MRPDAKAPLCKLIMQTVETPFEPRARNADFEVLEAELQELFVGQ